MIDRKRASWRDVNEAQQRRRLRLVEDDPTRYRREWWPLAALAVVIAITVLGCLLVLWNSGYIDGARP